MNIFSSFCPETFYLYRNVLIDDAPTLSGLGSWLATLPQSKDRPYNVWLTNDFFFCE